MADIRLIRDKARRDLHNRARVPAYYISPLMNSTPRQIGVRLHTKMGKTGQPEGNRDWAQNIEIRPRVVVLRQQLKNPRKLGIFSFGKGEAYKVDTVEPGDGITQTCLCSKIPTSETTGLPYPYEPGAPDPVSSDTGLRLEFPFPVESSEWVVKHDLGFEPDFKLYDMDGESFQATVRNIDTNTFVVGPLSPPIKGSVTVYTNDTSQTPSGPRRIFPFPNPATEWVVKHNLGYWPDLFLFDSSGEIFEATIRNIDDNTLIVGPLSPPVAGSVTIYI